MFPDLATDIVMECKYMKKYVNNIYNIYIYMIYIYIIYVCDVSTRNKSRIQCMNMYA